MLPRPPLAPIRAELAGSPRPDPDRANTARGAAHFLSETVGRVRYCGARGQLTVRADSGFYTPVCTRSTHFHRPAPLAACKAAFPAGVLQGWTPDAPAHAALGGVHLLEMRAPLFHIQEHVGQTTLHCRVTSRSGTRGRRYGGAIP